jgi:isopentenyl-diphosphate Delta-isomerase
MVEQVETEESVILVSETDVEIGTAGKLEVHRTGTLHRAFSVFVTNSRGEMLLQRRAHHKYHSGGLWSNTACGHPRPGEDARDAATRRTDEEMGFTCELERVSALRYRADVGAGLLENEYDHLFMGKFDGVPLPSENEVAEWRWVDRQSLLAEVGADAGRFTPWFHLALPHILPRWLDQAARDSSNTPSMSRSTSSAVE